MMATAHLSEPFPSSAADSDIDGLEPSPEWVLDPIAAERFGSPEAIWAGLLPEQDPGGHRQMLLTAAEVQRTGCSRPGRVPW